MLPVQFPLHHAIEIASCYSSRKASRSVLLPKAVHKFITKVMSGILKTSLFEHSRKRRRKKKRENNLPLLQISDYLMLHYRVLANGQRIAASWCFLQKCTINALDLGRLAESFNTMQAAKCNRIQATKGVLDRQRDTHCQQN